MLQICFEMFLDNMIVVILKFLFDQFPVRRGEGSVLVDSDHLRRYFWRGIGVSNIIFFAKQSLLRNQSFAAKKHFCEINPFSTIVRFKMADNVTEVSPLTRAQSKNLIKTIH